MTTSSHPNNTADMPAADNTTAHNAAATSEPGAEVELSSWLLLTVDGIEYGLSLEHVREIRRVGPVTPLPSVAPYVDGVTNLRGRIMPVVDLRVRFGLPRIEHDRFHVIVVIESGSRISGLVADAVQEVLEIPTAAIGPPPSATGGEDSAFVQGLAERDGQLTILLDAEALMVETEQAPSGVHAGGRAGKEG